jgi:tight adherence protein B
MTPTLASLLTFLAAIIGFVSIASLVSDVFLKGRNRLKRRLDDEFNRSSPQKLLRPSLFKDLQEVSADHFADDVVERRGIRDRLLYLLDQSGLDWSLSRLVTMSAIAAVFASVIAALVSGWLAAVVTSAAAAVAPIFYVCIKRNRRLEAIRRQLPDAYDLMARALRAGQTVSQTMQGVADEFSQPIAAEFSYCYEQQNLGLPTETALRDLARRTGLMEINIFVVAVIVQRQVGGNLAEMLEGLAAVVRERYRIRGAIKTLTAEGRLQAAVLMALPPAMFVAMLLLNRSYALVLLEYPWLLGGVLISMGIGALWIRKIINFDF